MREMTLQAILEARDRRAENQRRLLLLHACPVISFTMNIPGPVKNSPLIGRAFQVGLERLQGLLAREGVTPLNPLLTNADTGCEYLCAVRGEASRLKAICESIEDTEPLGRLFDMDVLDRYGEKLSRREPRGCLVCGAVGKGCASRRLHSVAELQQSVKQRLEAGLLAVDGERIGTMVTEALLDEVNTTPKPGLVDRNNNGAHRDMNRQTFYNSARALREYWSACFRAGAETAREAPEETFARLREMGLMAERKMLIATDGVNTHKGAIFLLGTVCGAIGRLWSAEDPCRDPSVIGEVCALMSKTAVEADFVEMEARGKGSSFGEQIYLSHGIRGARGELAEGLPSVLRTGLPHLQAALARGMDRNDAGAFTLLYLIAQGTDTNLMHRGGMDVATAAVGEVRDLLAASPYPNLSDIRRLDDRFIRQNLSPGGSADLLAATLFLLDWETKV